VAGKIKRLVWLLPLAVISSHFANCDGSRNREYVERIEIGMHTSDVLWLMGQPLDTFHYPDRGIIEYAYEAPPMYSDDILVEIEADTVVGVIID
jgi:hypothetical protein